MYLYIYTVHVLNIYTYIAPETLRLTKPHQARCCVPPLYLSPTPSPEPRPSCLQAAAGRDWLSACCRWRPDRGRGYRPAAAAGPESPPAHLHRVRGHGSEASQVRVHGSEVSQVRGLTGQSSRVRGLTGQRPQVRGLTGQRPHRSIMWKK